VRSSRAPRLLRRAQEEDAAGRVVFTFRIEQDGSIQRACSGDATSVEDEDAVRCMVTELRKVRFSAMSDEEVDLCASSS